MQTDQAKPDDEGASSFREAGDPPRRRYSDGPVVHAESIMAAAAADGPSFGENEPLVQGTAGGRTDPPRRRFSDGPLNRFEALLNQYDVNGSEMGGPQQQTHSELIRRRSDGPLHLTEALKAEADAQQGGGRKKPPRRRRSDGPLDQAQALLASAADGGGFGAIEPLPHGQPLQPPPQSGSAPPTFATGQLRRRFNSDGALANSEALLAAGLGDPDVDAIDDVLLAREQATLKPPQGSSSFGQLDGTSMPNMPRQGRRQLRRSNSDGVINQAESLMAAAADFNDNDVHDLMLQRPGGQGGGGGGQIPKRRYSDGPMAHAEALFAAGGMIEPDYGGGDHKPSGRGGGGGVGHRRSYSDDPTVNAEALLAASYEQESLGDGREGLSAAAGGHGHGGDNDNLGVEGQLQQLTLMQQMALQGLLSPNQMAALHNLQVQMHLQHSGLGISSMSPQPANKVKSAMKGSSMSPGPAQQPQQQPQQQGHQQQPQQQSRGNFDLSGFEPTSIQDMVAQDDSASPVATPVQSSQQNMAIRGNSGMKAAGHGVMGMGGMGGGGGIMAMKRNAAEPGKDSGIKGVASAACASSKKKSWKKPKDKPKRPLSAYNLFFQKERERMVAEAKAADAAAIAAGLKDPNKIERNPSGRRSRKIHGIGFASMAQSIAAKWKSLGSEDKKEFEERAAVERARYRRELDEWKKVKREKTLIQQRAELRGIQERRMMEQQAALAAAQHGGHQMALQFAQMQQQMGGGGQSQQQMMALQQQMMAAGQQQQQQQLAGMSLNQAQAAQMMHAQQQMQAGQQLSGQQVMPVVDESDFYASMFEQLTGGDGGGSAGVAAARARLQQQNQSNNNGGAMMFPGAGGMLANHPQGTSVQLASNLSSAEGGDDDPAADRVLSHGVSNYSSSGLVAGRHDMEKMMMGQKPEDLNACSFQMSDLSLDLAAQDPAVRPQR